MDTKLDYDEPLDYQEQVDTSRRHHRHIRRFAKDLEEIEYEIGAYETDDYKCFTVYP